MTPVFWRDYCCHNSMPYEAWNDPRIEQHGREQLEEQIQKAVTHMRKDVNRLGLPLIVKWNPVAVSRNSASIVMELRVALYFETEADSVLYHLSQGTTS